MRNLKLMLPLFLMACSQAPRSAVEIVKFDDNIIRQLIKESDTVYTEFVGREDFYTIDHYINTKDNKTDKIFKDSMGRVVGHNMSKNDQVVFVMEYFPNGQATGILPERINGKYNGPAKYFFENGRVRSEGQFTDGLWSGKWKNYNEEGDLISIDDFGNGSVVPLKTDKVN